ncbi:MAG: palmitoyltransferase pfa5 [Sclerophora amabilis]|nr:MAG: palmitoyltransferase pfa5 [Sclerophora amabilis]
MAISSIRLALINSSTVDDISRGTKVWQLAVHVPDSIQRQQLSPGVFVATPEVIFDPTRAASSTQTTDPQDASKSRSSPPKDFAVLRTLPGENPWDLGSYQNWKSVMGNHWTDWFLPIKRSPCCNHDGVESAYTLGPVVDRLRQEAGIAPYPITRQRSNQGRRRRRRSTTHMEANASHKEPTRPHRAKFDRSAKRHDRKRRKTIRRESSQNAGRVA